jgi:signal transduction histidine kinase
MHDRQLVNLRLGPRRAIAVIVAGLCMLGAGPPTTAAADLVPIARLKSPDVAKAEAAAPIRARGIVIWRNETGTALFLQDESGGIYARCDSEPAASAVRDQVGVGTEVEIVGVVTPAGFALNIVAQAVRPLGQRPLPEPIRQDPDRFFSGADNGELIEVTGIVRGVYDEPKQWRIVAETSLRTFEVEIRKALLPADFGSQIDKLADASVRFVGVAAIAFNARGELLWPRLFIAKPEWLTVVEPPRYEPFAAPHVPIDALARFRSEPPEGHMIRTAGTVVHTEPDRSIFLQERFHGTLIRTQANAEVKPGDRVEVAGFVDRRGAVACLANAVVRVISAGDAPQPIRITPDEIIAVHTEAARRYLMADPGDYEGCLVQFPAQLLEMRRSGDVVTLFLVAGKTGVTATMSGVHPGVAERLAVGSDLAVTGIVHGLYESAPQRWPLSTPSRLSLRVRSPADIALVRAPSWWTPRRLAVLLAAVIATLLAAVAWGLTLRRHVKAQERRLAAEIRNRHDAAIEFDATLKERNRLAANLHDTLLQTLGGIGYQLDACEGSRVLDEEESKVHFDVARRMVSHATTELHGSVWAMRSLPFRGGPFSAALRAMCDRVAEGHPARINVKTTGLVDELPEFVSGNLLLIVQEAVYNALRHGKPSVINVEVGSEPDKATLWALIHDDGCGFVPTASQGVEQGHFGLHGMQERAERLGGSMRIESGAGRGTTVFATIQRRDYDGDLVTNGQAIPSGVG